MSNSIKVGVKLRPLIKREKDENLSIRWIVQDNSIVPLDPEIEYHEDKKFQCDHIFDMDATNSTVFDQIVKPIVEGALDGFNGIIFSYGPSNSGKTYTMVGTLEEPGVILHTIDYIFHTIRNMSGREFLLRVSYLEIYHEKIYDLLTKDGTELRLHKDDNGQIIINCKEEIINSADNITHIMEKGAINRKMKHANRGVHVNSHSIFQIIIESQGIEGDPKDTVQVSQLNLVDLAGFERAPSGEHQIDTLESLIIQLSKTRDSKNYMDCDNNKLRELLQFSSNTSLMSLICIVSPVAVEETRFTLSLASQAKSIKNEPRKNRVIFDTPLLIRYAKQIAALQAELEKIQNGNSVKFKVTGSDYEQEKRHTSYLLEEGIKLLKTQIIFGYTKHSEELSKYKLTKRQALFSPGMFKRYLPVFHSKIVLPTIKEMSPERLFNKNREKSDLEVVECKTNYDAKEDSDCTERKCVEHVENEFSVTSMNNFPVTPERQDSSVQTSSSIQASPSTPKNILRGYILDLRKDLTELCEFTTLEKQLMCEESRCCTHSVVEQTTTPDDSDEFSSNVIAQLEVEKIKLAEDLQLKLHELDEIKNDIRGLRLDTEKLENTIYLLTSENMEMSTKLATQKERSKQAELNLQRTIDELYQRISDITGEKLNLESEIIDLNEQLKCARSKVAGECNNEQLMAKYQETIDVLKVENTELSAIIEEKNRELETIKESKSLLYDHECMYKDKVAILMEKNKCLVTENSELSVDLIDKIEENDMLKEQCNILKNKISATKNTSSDDHDDEHLRTENKHLKAEIVELKMRITMLMDENTKFSNNLFETIERLDNSSSKEPSNNTFQLSTPLDDTTKVNEPIKEASQNENYETLANKVVSLQDKVNYLTRLNKKLSDLKLSSCSQCAYLKDLNENRRALKLEANILNRKLEDLQRKFDQKCADTEALKAKVNQEMNLSFADSSFNSSFPDGMNITFVEEKVQQLNNELQTLRDDRDKLSVLYQEKCDELEKLHDEVVDGRNTDDDSKPKKGAHKNESRIEKIQKNIDQVKDDIDELKKNSTNFASVLNKFRTEKANLLHEISVLKTINEELQQKVSDNEISAATATEKAQILENEILNMTKEIERFSEKEKTMESEKLELEVELEDLRADRETKDILIMGLHRTIEELNESVTALKNEVDSLTNQKNELTAATEMIEHKHQDEFESLKQHLEELEKEKEESIEAEKRATSWANELDSKIQKFKTDLDQQEGLCKELQEKISQLEDLLRESENEKETLKDKLKTLEAQLIDSENSLVVKYKNGFESVTKNFTEYVEESKMKLSEINETLNKYAEENDNLKQELAKLRDIELKLNEIKEKSDSAFNGDKFSSRDNKLKEELDTVKECMIKELKSLKHKVNSVDLLNKTADEIFIMFLHALMSKEEEIIKQMREMFEKDIQKLEDERRQSVDAEKRMMLWAKELETEIEKLQTDLTKQESLCAEKQTKIHQLEQHLKENNHDKEALKEKIETLQNDLSNLQTELDKQCNVDVLQKEEAIILVQQREKKVQEAFKAKETELLAKMKFEKEMYEKRIEDLHYSIKTYKTKNIELENNIEGLEANEKQLKNIIEANALELKSNSQRMDQLNLNLEQVTEAYNEANREVEQKKLRIENITALLKQKCDTLSEYKNKLEIIMPDYEMLCSQLKERRENIERYKEEIETLKMEKEKQIEIIKDKLNTEEIKNVGLNKQLNELNNRNIALVEELDHLKENYEALQHANMKLERKIRNSTSKMKAESEMEELRDINKVLQNNLEGASNRISEMQDSKNKILKELVNLKGQYELLSQENAELNKALSTYKSKQNIPYLTAEEYDAFLQEKNKIALELEGKKVLLNQRDQAIRVYENQIRDLTVKNKNFDKQLEECATMLRKRDEEISNLKDKLYAYQAENKLDNELAEKVRTLEKKNKQLEDELEIFKTMRSEVDTKQIEEAKYYNERIIDALRNENSKLQIKLDEYENKLEKYPILENIKRRRSRNEMFNQNRQLEIDDIRADENEETCQMLRKRIQELELELVSKSAQISTLEIQIQSENFPYEQKCKELENHLLAYRKRNAELASETRQLQKTICYNNAWECDTCKQWQTNRREQACQTTCNNKLQFLDLNNEDRAKIMKLEKEKALIKDICRSRCRRIKQLEDKVRELEEVQDMLGLKPIEVLQDKSNQRRTSTTYIDKNFDLERIIKPGMKENVPAIRFELTKLSNYRRNIRNNY